MSENVKKPDPFENIRKRVQAVNGEGKIVHEFPSARQASKTMQVSYSTMSKRCIEGRTDKDGLKWKYVESVE